MTNTESKFKHLPELPNNYDEQYKLMKLRVISELEKENYQKAERLYKGLRFAVKELLHYKEGEQKPSLQKLLKLYYKDLNEGEVLEASSKADEMLIRAERDGLTGLYTRKVFDLDIEERVGRFKEAGQDFCLVMFDLDGLKQINDTIGHLAGDQAIITFGKFLQDSIRVLGKDRAYRIGGDEFALLLPVSEIGLAKVLKRLKEDVDTFNEKDKSVRENGELPFNFDLNFSVGYQFASKISNLTIDDLMSQADKELYSHKEAKK